MAKFVSFQVSPRLPPKQNPTDKRDEVTPVLQVSLFNKEPVAVHLVSSGVPAVLFEVLCQDQQRIDRCDRSFDTAKSARFVELLLQGFSNLVEVDQGFLSRVHGLGRGRHCELF